MNNAYSVVITTCANDEDAKIINNLLDLKLTNLNTQIVKCGFPANSLQKYLKLLSFTDYNIKIIDNSSNTSFKVKDFTMNNDNIDLLKTISNVNEENLSVKDAYDFITNIKHNAIKILKGAEENE